MFTKDQRQHLKAVKGPDDEVGLGSLRDRLQEDGHPLWPLIARVHKFHASNDGQDLLDRIGTYGDPGTEFWGDRRHGYLPYQHHTQDQTSITTGHVRLPSGKYVPMGLLRRGQQHFLAPLRHHEMEAIRTAMPPTFDAAPTHSTVSVNPKLAEEPEQLSRDNSLPPEVTKEAVGNALANAAAEAQKPHGAVYASSSEREGSTLEHALENFKKDAHSGLLKTAARLGVAYPAIGTWSDGAEESSLTETHPDEAERVGAILGLKHRQKGVALFKPDEKGPDAQHVVSLSKPLPLSEAHKRLLKNGIEFATFLPTDHRPDLIDTIHVLSNGPEDTQTTAERLATAFQKEEGSDYFQNKGHVSVPSAPTREGAAKLFKELLKRQSPGLS